MSTASQAKGRRWEAAICRYLVEHGAPYAERRRLNGTRDRGDVAGIPGLVIEAKSAAAMSLGAWLAEAEVERQNDGAALGVVWHKRRGAASAGDGFVTMTGAQFVRLLREAGYIEGKG
jgi:hypothetical protein